MTETTPQKPDVLSGLREKVADLESRREQARKEAASQRVLAVNLEARRRAELGRGEDVAKTEKEIRAARAAAEMADERAAELDTLSRQAQCHLEDAERGSEAEVLMAAIANDEGTAEMIRRDLRDWLQRGSTLLSTAVRFEKESTARQLRLEELAPGHPFTQHGRNLDVSVHHSAAAFSEQIKQQGGRVTTSEVTLAYRLPETR